MDDPYWELIGKEVIVEGHDMTYRGILIEMGQDAIHLESDLGWIMIPMEQVDEVRSADS